MPPLLPKHECKKARRAVRQKAFQPKAARCAECPIVEVVTPSIDRGGVGQPLARSRAMHVTRRTSFPSLASCSTGGFWRMVRPAGSMEKYFCGISPSMRAKQSNNWSECHLLVHSQYYYLRSGLIVIALPPRTSKTPRLEIEKRQQCANISKDIGRRGGNANTRQANCRHVMR